MTSKLKPWLFLTLIFIAGIMTGVALTIGMGAHFRSQPGAQQLKSHWMLHLTHQLNLTADQQTKIDPILTDAEAKIQAARRENMDTVSGIIQKTNAQIATFLTPDQQVELQKMSKEMDRDRDRMFPGHHQWGGPHGGPNGPPPEP